MLIGIIVIQAWWIRRSLQLNSQQFDAATYRSLESVVKQTEQKENFKFVHNAIDFDSILNIRVLHNHKNIKIYATHPLVDSLSVCLTNNVSVITQNGETIVQIQRSKDSSNNIVQSVVFNETGDNSGEEDDYINEKLENIDTLVEKMLQIRNPDSLSLKPDVIQNLLQSELLQNDLPGTFNFAMQNSSGEYAYRSPGFYDTTGCYRVSLYPNDLFGRKIILFLDIPGKLRQIHSDIWWAFLLSVMFTASLLFLFLYSIRLLIRHKNLLLAKNDFINHMSHEIKTPLAGISLGADMLIEKNTKMTPEQIGRVAHSIKEQTSRLHKDMSAVLLNSLVDEVPAMKLKPFNIIDTITQSLEEFRLILENKNVTIETHFPKEIITISGSEMLWQKVFCNLIDNSIKFSTDAVLITIRVSLIDSSTLLLQFSDNGIGISKEDLPHIFEKFYRSDYYKQSHIQGFGLGLSFVKKVVEMYSGNVQAESEPGKGTTITIKLPTPHE